jgi:hypothetical protein
MVDFPRFFATAGELYNLWPTLFLSAGGLFLALLGIVGSWSWRARGNRAVLAEAGLRGEINDLRDQKNGEINNQIGEIGGLKIEIVGLRGQIDVLTQRLALAVEQQKASEEYAQKVKSEFAEYKTKAEEGADKKELQFAGNKVESSVINLINANNLVTSTLTFPGRNLSTEWKPVDFNATQKSE